MSKLRPDIRPTTRPNIGQPGAGHGGGARAGERASHSAADAPGGGGAFLQRLRRIGLAAGLAATLGACWQYYSSAAIAGKVVDAKSGAPLAGVRVLAVWPGYTGAEGGNDAGNANVLEATTDAEGRYAFDAWWRIADAGFIHTDAPGILFFKSAYVPRSVGNTQDSVLDRWSGKMTSQWDGKTIGLDPFAGDAAERAAQIRELDRRLTTLGFVVANRCDWTKMPGMIRAIDAERRALVGAGVIDRKEPGLVENLNAANDWLGSHCSQTPKSLFPEK